jgi:hypothetical protein
MDSAPLGRLSGLLRHDGLVSLPPVRLHLLPAGTRHDKSRGARRVIASLATGRHRRLLALSAATFEAYARRWGWDLVLSTEELAPERPPSWSKIVLVRDLLERYETVLWLDADAVIVDLDRDIATVLNAGADLYLVRHPQGRDEAATVPNLGVMLLRRSPFLRAFLAAVWASEELVEHNWWENAAAVALLGQSLEPPYPLIRPNSRWRERAAFIDLAWNSVPGYCESPAPAINHHGRADHDDFPRRVDALLDDVLRTAERFPHAFMRCP